MEHNEDRESLKDVPASTLPLPPRFDAAASAAARPVEPLPRTRIQVPLKPNFSRLINRRSKFLALMAIVGLATGAAGGILVVEKDKQQRLENSASTIQLPTEQITAFDSAGPSPHAGDASLEVSERVENQVSVRRYQRRPRKRIVSEAVVLSNAEEDEEELDRDRDDDENENEDDDERRKSEDRERKRKDRYHDGDSGRSGRNRAVLYDVMRVRKP